MTDRSPRNPKKNAMDRPWAVYDRVDDETRKLLKRGVLGFNISRLRRRKRLSQVRLAKLTGATQAAICMLERGQRLPHFHTLTAIRRVLGVSWTTLLKGVE